MTNALSEWLEVEIYREGKIHRQRFEYWVDKSGKEHVGEPVTGLEITGEHEHKTGSKMTFKPDIRVFANGNTAFNYDTLAERISRDCLLEFRATDCDLAMSEAA